MTDKLLFLEIFQPEYVSLFSSRKIIVDYSNEKPRFTIGFLPLENSIDLENNKRIIEILKIANHLCRLPSESLRSIAFSEDLKALFEYLRVFHEHLAKYFVITCLNIQVPIQSSQKLKTLNMRICDDWLISLQSEFYRALWNSIRDKFLYLRKEITNLPFETDLELYCEILSQHAEEAFLNRTSEHFRVNTKEMVWLLKSMEKENLQLEEAEKNLTNPLVLQKSWLYKVASVLGESSHEDKQILTLLDELDKAWREEADARIEALSKRNGAGKVFKSHEWKNGKKKLLRKGRSPRQKWLLNQTPNYVELGES